jgi:pilus assembly protein Flp/PilA
MKQAWQLMRALRKDEEGAALIEYTVLLGIMLVAVIAVIILVGQWIVTQWTTLQSTLP